MNPEQEKLWTKYKLAEMAGSCTRWHNEGELNPDGQPGPDLVTLRIPRKRFDYHRARALSYTMLKLLSAGERLKAPPLRVVENPDDYVLTYQVVKTTEE